MHRLGATVGPDPLSEVLGAVRMKSTIFCRSVLGAPWGFSVVGRPMAIFHFIESGTCRLDVEGIAAAFELGPGDLVILPHGHGHTVRDRTGSPVTQLEDLLAKHPVGAERTLRIDGSPVTAMVCGGFVHEDCGMPFGAMLPPVLQVRGGSPWVGVLQEGVTREMTLGRAGSDTMLARLADLLFIEAVRCYFSDSSGEPRGWVAALRDPSIGAALASVHREPEKAWSVNRLARIAAMSRSAFAVRFSILLGESPMRYVTRVRMARAAQLLASTQTSVAAVAEAVGYESTIAFSRAFKRQLGLSPSEYRRAH